MTPALPLPDAPPAEALVLAPDNVPTGTSAASGIVAMSRDACLALLARQRLCVMACVDDALPYALPMFYGLDAERGTVVLGISEGRKTRALDANGAISIVVTETGPGDEWASVLVRGRAEVVTDAAEREAAVRMLMAHNRRPERSAGTAGDGSPPAAPPKRHSGGRIVRVADAEIAGREKRG